MFSIPNKNNGTAFGSRISIQDGENIIIRDGAAVFKENKLASWLNAEETQGANWLVEDTTTVVTAKDENKSYTYSVRKQKRSVKPVLSNGKPSFIVKLSTEGMVMEEAGGNLDFTKPENLIVLESLFSEAIKQQIEAAIDKSQHEIKADYLDFGKVFQRYHSKAFKSLNWSEVYPTVPIEVQVDCEIKGSGLYS